MGVRGRRRRRSTGTSGEERRTEVGDGGAVEGVEQAVGGLWVVAAQGGGLLQQRGRGRGVGVGGDRAMRALLLRRLSPLPQASEFHSSVSAAAGSSVAASARAKMWAADRLTGEGVLEIVAARVWVHQGRPTGIA